MVSRELSFFIFNIWIGAQIDPTSMIFDQIVSLCKTKKKGFNLLFPQLIFNIFSSEKDILMQNESDEVPPPHPSFKPFNSKDSSSCKSKAIVIPSVADPSGVNTASPNVVVLHVDLLKVRQRLDNNETHQQAILDQLSSLLKTA